jgi:PKD repeat protein
VYIYTVRVLIFNNPGVYPVELFVVGYHGGDSWTGHTNKITVTVSNDPEPQTTSEPTAVPAESLEPAAEPAAVESAAADPTASSTAANAAPLQKDDTLLYAVIAALGTLAVVIVVIIIVVVGRKKKTG